MKNLSKIASLLSALCFLALSACGVPTDDLGQNLGADTSTTLTVTPPDSPPPVSPEIKPPLAPIPDFPSAGQCLLAEPDSEKEGAVPCHEDKDCCPINECAQANTSVKTVKCLHFNNDIGAASYCYPTNELCTNGCDPLKGQCKL